MRMGKAVKDELHRDKSSSDLCEMTPVDRAHP